MGPEACRHKDGTVSASEFFESSRRVQWSV